MLLPETIPGTETKVTPLMPDPIIAIATTIQLLDRFPMKNPALSASRPAL